MADGTAWNSSLSFPFFAPLSGAVTQAISTTPYAGVKEIEDEVIRDAGSFGSQLGTLTDAVLELAKELGRDPSRAAPTDGPDRPASAIGKLQALAAQIDEIKRRHLDAAAQDAQRALDRLQKLDPAAYARLVAKART
jgi:hypothetical protein